MQEKNTKKLKKRGNDDHQILFHNEDYIGYIRQPFNGVLTEQQYLTKSKTKINIRKTGNSLSKDLRNWYCWDRQENQKKKISERGVNFN